MDSEIQGVGTRLPNAAIETAGQQNAQPPAPTSGDGIRRVFMGPDGMRAGWSTAIFLGIFVAFLLIVGSLAGLIAKLLLHKTISAGAGASPLRAIFGEAMMFVSLLGAAAIMAVIEKRRMMDYNLTGPHRVSRFLSGLVAGFAALSALLGAMSLGGWMHFGPVALSGGQIFFYAALWGFGFLLVGLTEEGICRCYLQFTLTRGINFWWALGVVAVMCASLLRFKGQDVWGVYGFALVGLAPCLWLYLRKSPNSGFWQAAWATSTFFGFVHTGNNGENWIGIFAAALIGFVFCASIWATGSAWWAIGCHAAWDWAETYFYGTADSGLPAAKGHLLTTAPAGSVLWSGGSDGPEGSLLVIPIVLLLLIVVLVQYRRSKSTQPAV
jgi:membrane protease YdiL (CAAX protease family)